MSNIYKKKSLKRLKIAKISEEKQLFYSLASNLYFAVFNYMQSIVGQPPKDKWKHISIAKIFSKKCYEAKILRTDILKKFIDSYEQLYELRVLSDYKSYIFNEEEKLKLKEFYNFFKEVIENG